jgi:hypothetical protein
METDAFGHDPQVVYMRRVFAAIERMQKEFLGKLGIKETDQILRDLRKVTLKHFEKLLALGMRRGIIESEEDAGTLYLYCLSTVLSSRNFKVSADALAPHAKIATLLKEAFG